ARWLATGTWTQGAPPGSHRRGTPPVPGGRSRLQRDAGARRRSGRRGRAGQWAQHRQRIGAGGTSISCHADRHRSAHSHPLGRIPPPLCREPALALADRSGYPCRALSARTGVKPSMMTEQEAYTLGEQIAGDLPLAEEVSVVRDEWTGNFAVY